MSDAVELISGDALVEFRGALKTLEQRGQELFGLAGSQINEIGGRVAAEVARRRGARDRAELALAAAQRAYEACCQSDPPRDCSGPAEALAQAQRQLAQAIDALNVAESCQRALDQAVAAYQGPSQRWATVLLQRPAAAVGQLDAALRAVDRYVAVPVPGAASLATGTLRGPGGGGGGRDGPADSARSADPRASCRAIPGTDVVEVPLGLIDTSDSQVQGPADFGGKGVSYDDVRLGLMRIDEEVLPAMRRGEGRSYFESMDARRDLQGVGSYRNLHEAFFGSTSVAVAPSGSGFTVINGYHRLFVARELELPSIPARIVGRS